MLSKESSSGAPLPSVVQHRLRIRPADLTDAAAFQTFDLGDFLPEPQDDQPYVGLHLTLAVGLLLPAAFSGGGATAVTVELGMASDLDFFLAATDIFTGAAVPLDNAVPIAPIGAGAGAVISPNDPAGFQFLATIRATLADVADLTAGDLEIVIATAEFPSRLI